jgi:hypothetical protein
MQWAKAVIFNENGVIAQKNCPAKKEELAAYFKAYNSRDNTIGEGFTLLGEHYDVHRYHPPLIYGRRGDAETGEGISLAVGKAKTGEKMYLLITYILPIISARAVPQQINFYNEFSKSWRNVVGELEKMA